MITAKDHTVQGLFVREMGPEPTESSPRLLMIPGGAHGWWAYEEWLPFFAGRGWRSYALSLRNHTGSYKVPDNDYDRLSVDDYVQDVLAALDWIDAPTTLLGHSMGAIVAQKAAEAAKLSALVLVSPVGPGQLGPINAQVSTDHPLTPTREAVRKLWFHNIDDKRFEEIYTRLTPESPSVMNEYRSGSVTVDRSKIRCPVLVVAGACDRSGVHDPREVAGFYDAPLILAADAGHDLMLAPEAERVAQDIADWLLNASKAVTAAESQAP